MTFNKVITARFTKLGIGLAALGLAVAPAGLAAAQTDPAAAPSKPTLDPERVALARQIFNQIGSANLQAMSKAMIASMQGAMTKTVSGLDAQRKQAMLDAVSDALNSIMPKAVDATVDAMAEDFDTAQLKDVLAFYTSPTGRIMINKMPLVMQQTSATMVAQMPEMVHQMELRYCAKVTCTTSEQQAFAAISAQIKARTPG
jgi:hypothetical protein